MIIENVNNMSNMFYDFISLKNINLSNLNIIIFIVLSIKELYLSEIFLLYLNKTIHSKIAIILIIVYN